MTSQMDDDFTYDGFWTPQTFGLQAIKKWVCETSFAPSVALSIDNNHPLDSIIAQKWPGIKNQRAVYPEYSARFATELYSQQMSNRPIVKCGINGANPKAWTFQLRNPCRMTKVPGLKHSSALPNQPTTASRG